MAGLADLRLGNRRRIGGEVDQPRSPGPFVGLLQELDAVGGGFRQLGIGGPGKDEPRVSAPGDDPRMLLGDRRCIDRLRPVHHDEAFLVQGGERVDERRHAGDAVPVQKAPQPGVGSAVVRRAASRREAVEAGQLIEQALGKGCEPVAVEAQFLKQKQLPERLSRDRFELVAVQPKGLEQMQRVEQAGRQRTEPVAGEIEGSQPHQPVKVPSSQAGDALAGKVERSDLQQVPGRQSGAVLAAAGGRERVPDLGGALAGIHPTRDGRRTAGAR